MKIAVDFDGVIIDRRGIPRKHDFFDDPPMDDARDAIVWLLSEGHDPYIFTNRSEDEWPKIRQWLDKWKFPRAFLPITNKKELKTSIYLDDRAVRFTNWQDFCKLIE